MIKLNASRNSILKKTMVVIISLLMALLMVTTIGFDVVYAANAPAIDGEAAIVMSGSTGEIVHSYRAERKLSFDGPEKIMIAMVVIDNISKEKEYEKTIQITKEAASKGDIFEAKETVSVWTLLNVMLLENSDEAATALAIYSCGSAQACVDQMNAKTQLMRLQNTKFANVTGEYDANQYSTCRDIAEIARASMAYDRIYKILSNGSYEIPKTEKHDARKISTSNILQTGENAYAGAYSGIVGTLDNSESLGTYLGSTYVDDMNIIVVILNENLDSTASDAKALFDYGNENVSKQVIVKKDKAEGKVKIRGGVKTKAMAYTARRGYVYIPPEGSDDLVTTQVELYNGISAPLKAGDKVGEYAIYVAGEKKGAVDLIVKEDIEKGWLPSMIYISNNATIAVAVILGLVLILLLWASIMRRKRKKERERRRREKIREAALKEKEKEDDRIRRNWTYR